MRVVETHTSPGNILGVDDDGVARLVLDQYLSRSGFRPELATSVMHAQQIIEMRPPGYFDCVITDYQMPEKSGLDLLIWLRSKDPCLASIVIAGAGEKDLVAAALRNGANNYLDKPYRREDLEQAVNKAVETTRHRRELARNEADAAAVGHLQRHLLGGRNLAIPGKVHFSHHPKRTAGGDFLNVHPCPDGALLVLAADVSGHDLKAAFVSAYFQGIVRGMLEKSTPIDEVLSFFNHCLWSDWGDRSAVTLEMPTSLSLCAAVLPPGRGQATLFSAGFPDAQVVLPSGEIRPCGVGGGHPMGWFAEALPERKTVDVPESGWLVLWTDGLEDHARQLAVSPWGLAYTLLRRDESTARRASIGDAIDDILVVAVALGSASFDEGFPILADQYAGDRWREIDAIQNEWRNTLTLAIPALSEERLCEILICLREGMLNALKHGCKGRPECTASLRFQYQSKARNLRAWIDDPGPGHGFDWASHAYVAQRDLLPSHRGLSMMHHFASRIENHRHGASLTLDFHLPEPP
ncbi:MAG: response regulator [Verrucomicrobiales bacterium]|nr:response regulator [Verrucomicrobiales bacterium]